jgi:hypothetical protein
MSHIEEIKTVYSDLDALEVACDRRGLRLVRGQTDYNWFQTFVGDTRPNLTPEEIAKFGKDAEHVITLKDPIPGISYEIGVCRTEDGAGWVLRYDTWGRHGKALSDAAGRKMGKDGQPVLAKLRREYSAVVIEKRATAKLTRAGFKIVREDLLKGIRMQIRRRA